MPIEIRELVVRATVHESESSDQDEPSDKLAFKQEVIDECLAAVIDLLKQQADR